MTEAGLFCSKLLKLLWFEGGLYLEIAFWILVPLLVLLILYKWREGPSYTKSNRIDGKVVIVTGCNTGIGRETALELAKRGGRIYMACRNHERCEKTRQEIIQRTGNTEIFNRALDLSSLQSVREFAERFNAEETRLDILINNAGVFATPRILTSDSYEQQLAINHLGHFLLTNLLLDKLKSSAPSRIVVLSSVAYIFGRIQMEDFNSERSYNAIKAYGQSKLANILFTRKLSQLLKGSKVIVNCVHPGIVHSDVWRYNSSFNTIHKMFSKILYRSTKAGAQTVLYLALDPELTETSSGGYYDRMALEWTMKKARDDKMADWLWRQSEEMVDLTYSGEVAK